MIGRSIGTVQVRLRELEADGYVANRTGEDGGRLARARYLTEAGKEILKVNEPQPESQRDRRVNPDRRVEQENAPVYRRNTDQRAQG